MDEREKQNNLPSDEGLFNDLFAKAEPRNTPPADKPDTESKAINFLNLLGFEHSAKTVEPTQTTDIFDLSDIPTATTNKKAIDSSENNAEQDFLFDFSALTGFTSTNENAIKDIHYHSWRISLYETVPFICKAEKTKKVFLIGYKNGQLTREKETHFSQHEEDSTPYCISLNPDPHFISYSFFYGFFRETVEKMCRKHIDSEELYVTNKKKVMDEFFKKYSFEFHQNPQLLSYMKEYIDTMIENIMDSLYKKEELDFNNGCL